MTSFERAIKYYGSQTLMAKALGVSDSQVTQWKQRGYMSARKALLVEVQTNGRVLALGLVDAGALTVAGE
jgi:DNA-binding transcriptional regulator YdaS (Cro superfamily)